VTSHYVCLLSFIANNLCAFNIVNSIRCTKILDHNVVFSLKKLDQRQTLIVNKEDNVHEVRRS
jgi:hypothetical protein